MKRCIFLFLALIISGPVHSFELGPDGKAAQTLMENIASGATENVLGDLDKNLGTPKEMMAGLKQLKDSLKNPAALRQYSLENRTVFLTAKGKFCAGELRVEENDGQSYLLRYHCQDLDGKFIFDSFRLYPVTEEQKANAKFVFTGRNLGDYALMLIAVFNVGFSIFSAVMVWKSGLRRKWLWILACLISVVSVSVSWTPGEFWAIPIPDVYFFKLLFLGAAFVRLGTYNPYVLSVGIPIGAILFWRAKHKAENKG